MVRPRWKTGLNLAGWLLVSLLLKGSNTPPLRTLALGNLPIVPQWASPWMAQLSAPDTIAADILQGSINGLSAAGLPAMAQGVAVLAGGSTVAQHQGAVPLPAASLTKLAVTLAALQTWEASHQFETLVGVTGPVENGIVRGDLVVRASQDPFFVWEEAIALANALQQAGIQQVEGNLIILGDFAMNFSGSPRESAALLKQGMDGAQWPAEANQQYSTLLPGTPVPQLKINGGVQVLPLSAETDLGPTWVVSHRSLPVAALLKAMNIYSNNAMADRMAQAVGGPSAVVDQVIAATGLPAGEIRLINGSGLGEGNQISPRGVVAIMVAMQRSLQSTDYTVADLMPVIGRETGTLRGRNLPLGSAMKTGSLNTVSSLAGVFATRDRGLVWFAILNRGQNLDGLRVRQDQLINALVQHWGAAESLPAHLRPTINFAQDPYRLGDPARNQILNQN
ncbi:MAG: D-alanyl-D-alanine carboxypeptidase [Cyanobacteria bacterium P01_H01_bin.119]